MTGMSYDLTPRQVQLVLNMWEWADYGLCHGHPLFLCETPEPQHDAAEQKKLCRLCPVKLNCLNHALEFPEFGGVWGGMGPKERTKYRQHQQRSKS